MFVSAVGWPFLKSKTGMAFFEVQIWDGLFRCPKLGWPFLTSENWENLFDRIILLRQFANFQGRFEVILGRFLKVQYHLHSEHINSLTFFNSNQQFRFSGSGAKPEFVVLRWIGFKIDESKQLFISVRLFRPVRPLRTLEYLFVP